MKHKFIIVDFGDRSQYERIIAAVKNKSKTRNISKPQGLKVVGKLPRVEAILVGMDGTVHVSPGLQQKKKWETTSHKR